MQTNRRQGVCQAFLIGWTVLRPRAKAGTANRVRFIQRKKPHAKWLCGFHQLVFKRIQNDAPATADRLISNRRTAPDGTDDHRNDEQDEKDNKENLRDT